MGSITLHDKLGVNARLCFCPRCGGETNSLVLLGSRNYYRTCTACKCRGYGMREGENCRCGRGTFEGRTELQEYEKIPGELCDQCAAQIKEFEDEVAKGGVYFVCEQCNANGVIKGTSELAKEVRNKSGIAAPNPVVFRMEKCEWHTPKEA